MGRSNTTNSYTDKEVVDIEVIEQITKIFRDIGKENKTMPNTELSKEYSALFDSLRRNRVEMSFYKYGPAKKNYGEGRVDAIATAERCIEAFKKDKNTEHLVDAANYLMFRFMYPLPGEEFNSTDSSGSVGTVGTPINMED